MSVLSETFRRTDGDLKELARTLVNVSETWSPEFRKLKRPSDWLVAVLRATGTAPGAPRLLQTVALLGEPLWRPPAPKGFADDAAAWLDGLARRLDVAGAFAALAPITTDPAALLDTALGPLAGADTRAAVSRAESRGQGLTLALMAPEFLRR